MRSRGDLKNILSPQFLNRLYVEEKKSRNQIAQLVGCSRRTVQRALRRHKIQLRSISEATKLNTPKGPNNWMYGKKFTGKLGFNYKDGRTPLYTSIRNLVEYDRWRIAIFERDNYTCRECFNRGVVLHAHHSDKKFYQILEEFLNHYSQFSPIEDKETLVRLATTYEPFWTLIGNHTLCFDCHSKYTTRPDRRTNEQHTNK